MKNRNLQTILPLSIALFFISIMSLNAQFWQPLNSGITTDLNTVSFINETDGWAAGANGIVLKTTDGGTSWTQQSTGFPNPIVGISFPSATNGYVINGFTGIKTTTDGGATWVNQTSASSYGNRDIQFINPSIGWIVGAGGTIQKTTDGGSNWILQTTNTLAEFTACHFISLTTGWAVGYDVVTNQAIMYKTTDGGTTWAAQNINTGAVFNDVFFDDQYRGIAVGWSGAIFRTFDGGATWSNNSLGFSFGYPNIKSVAFGNSYLVWIITEAGKIYASDNIISATWYEQASGTTNALNKIIFINNLEYIVGSGGTILQANLQNLNATSIQNGNWNNPATWSSGIVPDAIMNVSIEHDVTMPANTSGICGSIDIYSNGKLLNTNAGGYVECRGGLYISGAGEYRGGDYLSMGYGQYTGNGGVIAAAATKAPLGYQSSPSLPGYNTYVYISDNAIFEGYLIMSGNLIANGNATVNLKGGDFTGWDYTYDPTPQYIVESLGSSTITVAGGQYFIRPNGSQPHFSPNVVLTSATPTCPSGAIFTNFGGGGDYTFGADDRDQTIDNLNTLNGSTISSATFKRLKVNNLSFYTSGSNAKTLTSSGSKFANLTVFGDLTTMVGDFELINNCSGTAPTFTMSRTTTTNNIFGLKINVTDTAILDLGTFATNEVFNLLGSFEILNGKVVVKGGTLDLRNATVSGLDETHYFITKPNFNNTKMGAVLLPAVGSTPVNFNLGVSIPNGNNPPTSVYAPVNIVSNNGNTNISINLQTLTAPSGYIAPTIQWNITPSGGSPNLNITFSWPPSTESTQFANYRSLAKIYHYNSSTMLWEQLTTSALVTNPDGSFSLTASNVVSFSPFAVMIPLSVLSADLIHFTAKTNGDKALLNWQTASEINVKNFDIEKSTDGHKFEKIAEVKANNTPSVYQAFDNEFVQSSYYRLKINDLDGKLAYSKIINLQHSGEKLEINRKDKESLFIETNQTIELVSLTNTLGQVLRTTKQNEISLIGLPTGNYIISVRTAKQLKSQKIMYEH